MIHIMSLANLMESGMNSKESNEKQLQSLHLIHVSNVQLRMAHYSIIKFSDSVSSHHSIIIV